MTTKQNSTFSMTGYGREDFEWKEKKISIEIKSLNSKQADLFLKIPNYYKSKEFELRNDLVKVLERGKIEVFVSIQTQTKGGNQFNKDLAQNYYSELKELEQTLKIPNANSDYLSLLMRMPDIMSASEETLTDEEWDVFMNHFRKALDNIQAFRMQEGDVLRNELQERINNILGHLQKVKDQDVLRMPAITGRIQSKLEEVLQSKEFDRTRLEQELMFYSEKIDITEEKLRLATHCDYFINTLNEEVNKGRKLLFITQEIGREINTIGSKANDSTIQKLAVEMKDELEKIKEQCANVL